MNSSKTTISTIVNYGGNSSNQPQHNDPGIPHSPLTTDNPTNLVRDNTIIPPQTVTDTVCGGHDDIVSMEASQATLSPSHTGAAVTARRRRGKITRIRHFLRKRFLSCFQRPRTDEWGDSYIESLWFAGLSIPFSLSTSLRTTVPYKYSCWWTLVLVVGDISNNSLVRFQKKKERSVKFVLFLEALNLGQTYYPVVELLSVQICI